MFTLSDIQYERYKTDVTEEYRVNEYFTYPLDEQNVLVTTRHRTWVILDPSDYELLAEEQVEEDPELYSLLADLGILITQRNMNSIVEMLRDRYSFMIKPPLLLILVPTNRCNNRCLYCHAKSELATDQTWDMPEEILYTTLDFFMSVPDYGHPRVIEFQGGEPLLKYPTIQKAMDYTMGVASQKKIKVKFQMVSNLTAMTDEIASDIRRRGNIGLTSSFDGPEEVHNQHRFYVSGKGTYDRVIYWVKRLREEHGIHVGLMPTITTNHLGREKELIDEYVKLGANGVVLRPVHSQGTHERAQHVRLTGVQYAQFFQTCVDYIIELNKSGTPFIENETAILLSNMLTTKTDFMCIRRPCGAGSSQITVDEKGDIVLCDVGRTVDMMHVGNVMTHTYDEVVTSEAARLIRTIDSSTLPKCNACAFNSFCGHCAVRSIREHGSPLPEGPNDFECDTYMEIFPYLFKQLKDPVAGPILYSWFQEQQLGIDVSTPV
ncbi:radical SAM protein [Candidatus Poribacteria bacterium]|nr:radical SAM protein [Candidatus Poribacteria bacterium]